MTDLKKKTLLVTGAAGFIGSQFCESCPHQRISLISVDQLIHFKARETHQKKIHFGRIIDRDQLLALLETAPLPIDAIVHLGAITDTRETNLELLNQYNLDYSKALWNYSKTKKIPFYYASSAATYGDGSLGFDDEELLMQQLKPLNPYGISKLQFDQWVLEQEREGQTPPQWAGFKFFNVYGFGEQHKGFMASVVFHAFEEIQRTGSLKLFKSHKEGISDGFQKRDFIYVKDVIEVLHFSIEAPIHRGIYNLGTGQARTFLDLGRAVFQALGRPVKIQFIETPLSVRNNYQYFTEAKMNRLLKLSYSKPFTSLEAGINETVQKLLTTPHES